MTAKMILGQCHLWMTDDVAAVECSPMDADFVFSSVDDVAAVLAMVMAGDVPSFVCGYAVELIVD